MEKRFRKSLAPLKCSRLLSMIPIALLSVGLLLSPQCIGAQEGYLLSTQERDWLAKHPLISLAPDPDYPPIEYFGENREYRGIAADYIALIEKKLGFQFKIARLQSWDEILDKAKRRQIDMFGAAAETPQRSEYMLFTHPFVEFPSVIIVRKNVSESLSLEKLEGMKVAVVSGYADHDYIKNHYPRLQLDEVPTVVTGLRKVSFGMVDALVANLATATYYIEKEGITNLHLAGNTGYMYRLGFGVRNDWPELINILEKGLAQITPMEREAIFKKWIHLGDASLFANREFWIIVLSGLSVAIFVVLGLFFWNRSLTSSISLRTRELSNELAERKQAEEALRQSEKRYRVLHESLRDAFVQVSMDGRIIECNDLYCRMLGYSPEEMRALTYQELTPERWHAAEDDIVREQIIPRGYSDVYEKQYRRKDGTIFPVELRTILSRDGSGRPNGMWGIVRDITERKQMEDALRKAHDMLEQRVQERTAELTEANKALKESQRQLRTLSSRLLTAQEEERKRIAHELHDSIGGTLSAIKFGLENALGKMQEGEDVPETLQALADTTQHAMEEARRIYMDLRPSILDDLGLIAAIRWFTRQFQVHYPSIHVEQHVELEEHEIPELLKMIIFRVMQEAFHNAAKHSQARLLDLSLTTEDSRMTLVVSDNGVGFTLRDPSVCRSGGGGLGLESMQERVESSGGVLVIRSAKAMGVTIQAVWDLSRFS